MTEITMHLSLQVDVESTSMDNYEELREEDAGGSSKTAEMEEAHAYLTAALHGWTTAGTANYATLQASASFNPKVDSVAGTSLPHWDDIPAAVRSALEAYNGDAEFRMKFELVEAKQRPHCVKFIRRGGKREIVYNYNLELSESVQDATECNRLPMDIGTPVPDVLSDLAGKKVVMRYQMIIELEPQTIPADFDKKPASGSPN